MSLSEDLRIAREAITEIGAQMRKLASIAPTSLPTHHLRGDIRAALFRYLRVVVLADELTIEAFVDMLDMQTDSHPDEPM